MNSKDKIETTNSKKVFVQYTMNRRCIKCGYGFSGKFSNFYMKDISEKGFTCVFCRTFNPAGDKPLRLVEK